MEINFKGKRALVTGAGKGIGKDVALLLHELGAEVVAISRTKEDLEALKKEIACTVILADLEDANSAKEAAEKAGDIDLLVNNAGVASNEPFLETSVENFSKTFNINVRSILIVSQVIAKKMVQTGKKGSIVNVSSQASMVALQNHTSYCTSKGAVDQLTRMMALELGPHNIRVNAVNPTVVMTLMGELNWSDPQKAGPMLSKIPMGRFAKPREVSEAIVYLLSDRASMINGSLLPVDGGFLAC
eukprot:TRINITY_DN2201_c0_g3_i1.p2 TRINITY_DN2201_c0_g3~~TRINITY_DN2201_c0_g3_i1.p2  ORF type:complete len:255 (-),score=32.84 TRINITY_DN2201_c0_g3_i1:797-1528(-)